MNTFAQNHTAALKALAQGAVANAKTTQPAVVGAYLHGDLFTELKGLGACKVATNLDDFTTRSKPVVDFARRVAMVAYGYGVSTWEQVLEVAPELAQVKANTELEITSVGGRKAEITVLEIVTIQS